MKKTACITGATSGIGKATAKSFAIENYDLIICGRRGDRLKTLKNEIESEFNVKVIFLSFDITKKEEVKKAFEGISNSVDVLVNNAGMALGATTIDEGEPDDWDQMIHTNLNGLLYVTHALLHHLKQSEQGHIINVGSIAGKLTYKKMNVYSAVKSAVDMLSKSMRIDLLPQKIKVTVVHPGMVQTEFFNVRYRGDKERANKVFQAFEPLQPEDVAETILFAATRPAHVNLNEIEITPTDQANTVYNVRNV